MNRAFQLFEHSSQSLWLHGQHEQRAGIGPGGINRERGLFVLLKHLDAVFCVQFFPASRARMTANDLGLTDKLLAQESGNNRLGHHSAADERQTAVAERICFGFLG